jgi:hypothetical protein
LQLFTRGCYSKCCLFVGIQTITLPSKRAY